MDVIYLKNFLLGMKSLKESLFDKDLITSDMPIDTKAVHSMLLDRIYKMKKDVEKRGWGVHFFNDVIILSKLVVQIHLI